MKLFLINILLLPLTAFTQVKLAGIFSDNMVLQRDQPVTFWGSGVPGSQVRVSFSNEEKIAVVKADSSWKIYFKKQNANPRPQSIQISSGKETIEIKNILMGDVWLCLGQSNMEWALSKEMHFKEEVKNTAQPLIRFYNPSPAGRYVYGIAYTDSLNQRLNTRDFYEKTDWKQSDSNTVKAMSAIGYYFAKDIVTSEKIPVGLINLSIGGAPIETFIRREALQRHKQFAEKVKGNWLENDALPEWIRERGKQNIGSNPGGFGDEFGLNHAYKPGFAYTSGVAPIVALPIKGILWYQGESNAQELPRVQEYRALLKLMIDDYRKKWKQPSMPFFWVQLSSIDSARYRSQYWPKFRDEQRKLLSEVKNSGMVVCSDIGSENDVHPTNKKAVGERLARWALNKTYKRNIVPCGPLPLAAKYVKGRIVITFQYAANRLKTSDGKTVRGFSTNDKTEVEATIQSKTVVIAVKEKPAFIYYAWKPFTDANLINWELLPASTFKLKVD